MKEKTVLDNGYLSMPRHLFVPVQDSDAVGWVNRITGLEREHGAVHVQEG